MAFDIFLNESITFDSVALSVLSVRLQRGVFNADILIHLVRWLCPNKHVVGVICSEEDVFLLVQHHSEDAVPVGGASEEAS